MEIIKNKALNIVENIQYQIYTDSENAVGNNSDIITSLIKLSFNFLVKKDSSQ